MPGAPMSRRSARSAAAETPSDTGDILSPWLRRRSSTPAPALLPPATAGSSSTRATPSGGCRRGSARGAVESEAVRFRQLGVNLTVLEPGQPNGLYHSENQQEAFLVLSGECRLLVEETERRLGPWDLFHCPAGVDHIAVGAGDGPCVILMLGTRSVDEQLHYPVSELAAGHGAGAEQDTHDPDRAYARYQPPRRERPASWDRLPWA